MEKPYLNMQPINEKKALKHLTPFSLQKFSKHETELHNSQISKLKWMKQMSVRTSFFNSLFDSESDIAKTVRYYFTDV